MSAQLQVTGEAKIRAIQGPVVANSGVITALNGAASQYVRGDGTLADFPTSTGGGSSVSYYLNSSVSQGTIGGVAYRQLGKTPIAGAGTDITISANGYVASYITDANDPALLEVPAGNFNCEFYFSVNSNNHNPYVYAELYKYDGTTFTLLGSNQAIPEYLTNGTTLSAYYFAIPVAVAALNITDRLAIRIYVNVDTRTVTLHTENNHLCQVVTTFSKGLTSLNNLTRQVQFFGTGTSGTDFNISSSTATHTFNLPIASATNTGKLSSSDWSVFNAKEPAIAAGTILQYYRGDKTFQTLNTTAVVEATNLYFTDARARLAISLTTTNTSGAATYNNTTGVLNIPDYSANTTNFVTIGTTQTITGTKTFNEAIRNESGLLLKNGVLSGLVGYTSLAGITNGLNVQLSGSSNAQSLIFQSASSYSYTFPASSGTLALASDLSSYVPTSRTLTINGETYDLSANRSWTITGITGSGTSGQVPYFNGTTSLTSEAGFIYDASTNRLGVNTSVPNATIGADAALNSGYGLLIKTGSSNYNGIGIAIDSTYGNTIETAKLGTASARNLTLLNQTGFISLTEAGNLGVNILTPNFGIDIYNSTQSQLWLHNAASGLTATDGVRLALFNNLSANLRNFDGGLSLTAEGDFQIITIGAENLRVNSANGFVGIGNPASLPSMLTVNGGATISGLTTGQVLFPTSGGTLSGTNSLFWDNATDSLRIGSNTSANRRLSIFSSSDANHFALISNAPAITLSNNFSYTYYATVGMATATNNFVSGTVAGDLVLGAFNTNSIIFSNANTNTQRMKLTSGGDLVIGATSADTKLDVRGEISLSYSASNGLRFYNQDRSNWSSIGNDTATGTSNANLVFRTSAGTALTIAANRNTTFATAATFSSNVGIGTAPSAWSVIQAMQILNTSYGASPNNLISYMSSNVYFDGAFKYITTGTATQYRMNDSGAFSWLQASSGTAGNAISFTTAMTITSGGNVLLASDKVLGINTSDGSDNGYLALCGASGDGENRGGHIYLSGNERAADAGTVVLAAGNVSNGTINFRTGAGTERMRITSGGSVCINSTSPLNSNARLNISGEFYMGLATAGAGNSTLKYNTGTGLVTFDTSARIFKKDIVDLDYGLDSILKMKPKMYKWKSNDYIDLGFIADEMYELVPEIVALADNKVNKNGLNDGEPLSINYDRIVPILVKAVQEQTQIIKDLEARIVSLESK